MDEFFSRFFPNEPNTLVAYYQAIEAVLPSTRAVLDVGCGCNRALTGYRNPAREVWGTDFQRHPELAFPEWFRPLGPNGQLPFPDQSFDLVTTAWVAEHVADPHTFLAEVQRVLRPGGTFVAMTINGAHYTSYLARLLHLLPHTVTQELVYRLYGRPRHDTFPTWYRLNTPAQFRRGARRAGLEVGSVRRVANAHYYSFSPLLFRAAVLLDWLLERAGTERGRVYLVVTLRRPGSG